MCHGWVRIFGILFQLQKREINDKGGYRCQAWCIWHSISYDEVKKHKQWLTMTESTLPTSVVSGFTQFVADNVDHNALSLDGRGTCQGMAITCFMGVLQITYWKELSNTEIDRSLWGWTKNELLEPVMIHKESYFLERSG